LPGREPDLLFVAAARAAQVKRTYVDGPADVAVEVISDESRTRDRREKFVEYETGGVTEYWLIDPDSRSLECYERGDDGRYRPAFAGSEGVFRSAVVEGFRFRVEWLWERPPLREALAELGVR
jgi:Uma2 family endonuclease